MKSKVLQAERVGILVSSLLEHGRVVSVYDRAVNILMEDGLLLSLVATVDQMTALAIQLSALFEQDPSLHGVRCCRFLEGNQASLAEECLTAGDSTISLSNAESWSGEYLPFPDEGFTIARVSRLEEILIAVGKERGFWEILADGSHANPCVARAKRLLDNLVARKNSQAEWWTNLSELSKLLGLGPGFTPAGDDFLCGILLGEKILISSQEHLNSTEAPGDRCAGLNMVKKQIRTNFEKTTSGGKTLLWQAMKGQFPYYLLKAVRGISTSNNVDEMRTSVECAAKHGETSGTDALAGLCWFFKNVRDSP
jgi:hypothetical protein